MMRMRNAAATMHQRDVLMATAFEGIGGLPMATIERFRELKQKEVEEMLAGRGIKAEPVAGGGSALPARCCLLALGQGPAFGQGHQHLPGLTND
jgi:hypothetical protein